MSIASSRSYGIQSSIKIFKSRGNAISMKREMRPRNDKKLREYEKNIDEETVGTMPGSLP